MKNFVDSNMRHGLFRQLGVVLFAVLTLAFAVSTIQGHLVRISPPLHADGHVAEITRTNHYSQRLEPSEQGLKSISILFGTYARYNSSSVSVKLIDTHHQVIQKWTVPSKILADNAYYQLTLSKPIPDSKGRGYQLDIRSNAKPGNGVTVYSHHLPEAGQLLHNGKSLKQTLCFQMTYQEPFFEWFHGGKAMLLTAVLIISIVIFSGLWLFRKLSPVKMFGFLWVLISTVFFLSAPLFSGPDEQSHFYRSYEISYRHLTSITDSKTGRVGRPLPIDSAAMNMGSSWSAFSEHQNSRTTPTMTFYHFIGAALYSPISYIPQSLGIFIARHITNRLVVIGYVARLVNWLCVTGLLILTIQIIPFGKKAVSLIALLPMNVYMSTTLSPDAMTVSAALLLVSLTLYLKYKSHRVLKCPQLIGLYALAAFLSMLKIVYLPICLAYLAIPPDRFRSVRAKWVHISMMATLSVGLNIGWLGISRQFLTVGGTNSGAQVSFVLHHPIEYLTIVIRTIFHYGDFWATTMIGSQLGKLDVPTSGILVLGYLGVLAFVFIGRRQKAEQLDWRDKGLSGFIVFSVVLLVLTSLYVQWTPLGNSLIKGVQGRYFIPVLLPIYLFVTKEGPLSIDLRSVRSQELSLNLSSFVAFVNLCACFSLIDHYLP